MTTIAIVAGEPSGDLLGARLMAALAELAPDVRVVGIGGERMAERGLASLFPMEDLSVMGLLEVLPRALLLRRRLREAAAFVRATRPDVLVTIDSPGFTFRLARALQGAGVPLVHLVAPTVWAWKPKRAAVTAELFDRLLCLLPFEPPYFTAHGMRADFIGHPVLESGADRGDAAAFRIRFGVPEDHPVLLLLPGSRRMEVERHLPIFRAAAAQLGPAQLVIPTVAALRPLVERAVGAWAERPIVVTGPERYDAFAAARAALAASGTVGLELALARVPHVVAYRVNPLTAAIARRLVKVRYVNLVNLLLDRLAVPELLQERCTAPALAAALAPLLQDAGARAAQLDAAAAALRLLDPGESPSRRAARAILDQIAQGARA